MGVWIPEAAGTARYVRLRNSTVGGGGCSTLTAGQNGQETVREWSQGDELGHN